MKYLLCLAILVMPGTTWSQDFVVQPYLQNPSPTSIWIAWETNSGDQSRVDWGLGDATDQMTEGHSHAGPGAHRHHKVQLTNLQPATRYSYRVVTGEARSAVYHFKTPPTAESESPFRLVAMSDMQRDHRNPDRYREIVEDGVIAYVRETFGPDLAEVLGLVLIPGDLVDSGRIYSQWANTFFTPGVQLMPYVPFMPVPGNHENDSDYFFDYFHLPQNGTPGFEEHWWYTDYSNVRIIGLDSNSAYRIGVQLDWLEQTLADACASDDIDFVFAQLHHPHESELWIAGNTAYTGDVIQRLEDFSSGCDKPSIHFFGHTHGYSRGQSRDHRHLMVNVATAGGNIDYWGEYRQVDYEEYTVSQDEYGFVLIEVEAGDDPRFRLTRVGRGDENQRENNVIRDRLEVRRNNQRPARPRIRGPLPDGVDADCFTLAMRRYRDPDGDTHQGTHWQVSTDCDDFTDPVIDRWRQHQNWYDGQDRQAGDDLTDEIVRGLEPMTDYCWRARVRDAGLTWSEWSEPEAFRTGDSDRHRLPLANPGAEEGVEGWTVEEGIFESLESGQCNAGDAYAGQHFFSVGGACDSGDFARVSQRIDVAEFAAQIDAENTIARFGGYLRNWDGNDHPEMWLRFYDDTNMLVGESEEVGSLDSSWREITHELAIPANTRAVEFVLTGTRNAGTDNDSYFDDLFMDLIIGNMACDEAPVGPPDPDAGVVVDAGPPTDGGLNPSDALTATDGGFVSDARTPGPDTASGRPESDTGRPMTDGGNDKRDGQAGATQTGSESAESGCSCRIGVRTGDSVYIFGIILFFGFSRRRRRYIV